MISRHRGKEQKPFREVNDESSRRLVRVISWVRLLVRCYFSERLSGLAVLGCQDACVPQPPVALVVAPVTDDMFGICGCSSGFVYWSAWFSAITILIAFWHFVRRPVGKTSPSLSPHPGLRRWTEDSQPIDARIRHEVQVMFYDTDCAAVVHNIAYLRFIEAARTLLAGQLGMSLAEMARSQQYPVVVRTEIDYKRPGVLGDTLAVDGWLERVERIRFWCAFTITRPSDGAVLIRCRQMLALVQMPEWQTHPPARRIDHTLRPLARGPTHGRVSRQPPARRAGELTDAIPPAANPARNVRPCFERVVATHRQRPHIQLRQQYGFRLSALRSRSPGWPRKINPTCVPAAKATPPTRKPPKRSSLLMPPLVNATSTTGFGDSPPTSAPTARSTAVACRSARPRRRVQHRRLARMSPDMISRVPSR